MEYKIREKLFGANKASAVGTSLTLNDTVKYPINKLTIDGVCKQETTTGKNLLDYVSNLITSANGLTNVINEDGSITTTGKPTSNYSTIIKTIDITDILEDGQTYTISQGNASDNVYVQIAVKKVDGTFARITSARGSKSFEVNKTIYTNYSIMLQTNTISNWGDSPLTITNKYMLCKGTDTADTSFEPYTGGQPSPSPDFQQPISVIENSLKITSCNKNLFDEKVEQGAIGGSVGQTYEQCKTSLTTRIRTINLISLDINKNYTISIKNGYEYAIFSFDNEKKLYDCGISEFALFSSKSITFNNVPNIAIAIRKKDNSSITPSEMKNSDFQIEFGTTATSYEKHLETQITANLPEGEFVGKLDDTYKDTLKVVYKDDGHYHLVLNKMIGKIVLDGSEEWHNLNLTFYADIKWGKPKSMCTHFTNNGSSWTSNDEKLRGKYTTTNVNNQFKCMPLSDMTLVDFKTWLSENNVTIYYILETPYTVDLGIVDTLLSYDEVTNVFSDSDLYPVINVKYYKGLLDISNYEFSIKEV